MDVTKSPLARPKSPLDGAKKTPSAAASDALNEDAPQPINARKSAGSVDSSFDVLSSEATLESLAPPPKLSADQGPLLPLQARLNANATGKSSDDDGAASIAPSVAQSLNALLPRELVASNATSVLDGLKAVSDDALMNLLATNFSAREHQSKTDGRPPLKLGVQFVDVGRLVPGQLRISIDRVREKVATQVELGGHQIAPNGDIDFGYGEGTASVPLDRPKPAIAGPNGAVLVIDGNHQAVASILAGAKQTPIDIVADHQHLSPEAFDALAQENGWTYLKPIGGDALAAGMSAEDTKAAQSYGKLANDPVRFLMSEAAFKASRDDDRRVVFEEVDRPETRSWVKLKNKTVDFVEFILADVLYQSAEADPTFKAALLATDDDTLAKRGPVVREALNAAIDRGDIDPNALGIMVLPNAIATEPMAQRLDMEALALDVDAAL